MHDKLQPYSIELEKNLITAVLRQADALQSVSKVVSQNAFYDSRNGFIFEAGMFNLVSRKPITAEAIIETLKESGNLTKAGGLEYINELRFSDVGYIEPVYPAVIIFQKYIRREVIRAAHETLQKAHDETVDEFNLLDEITNVASNIHTHLSGAVKKTIADFTDSYYKETLDIINAGSGIRGLRTYINAIDYRLGGLCSGRMILFAGRPGSGKTSFIIQLIVNMCLDKNKSKLPIAVYSLEMSGEELVNRCVSGLLKYPYEKLSKGDLPENMQDNFQRAVNHISQSNLSIVDNMNDLRSIVVDLKLKKEKENIKLAIIDYIQLVRATDIRKTGNREEEVGHISRTIKSLSKELKIPIVALVQLNREVEKRSSKKPQLSDLRESGSLEMDADSVTFIYRPKYAGFDRHESGEEVSEHEAYFIHAKNRHGPVGEDEVYCDIACNIFMDKNNLDVPF